jgi:hypothetical protein
MDFKLKVVVVPVSDVARAKQFCKCAEGGRDADVVADELPHRAADAAARSARLHAGLALRCQRPRDGRSRTRGARDHEGRTAWCPAQAVLQREAEEHHGRHEATAS